MKYLEKIIYFITVIIWIFLFPLLFFAFFVVLTMSALNVGDDKGKEPLVDFTLLVISLILILQVFIMAVFGTAGYVVCVVLAVLSPLAFKVLDNWYDRKLEKKRKEK